MHHQQTSGYKFNKYTSILVKTTYHPQDDINKQTAVLVRVETAVNADHFVLLMEHHYYD